MPERIMVNNTTRCKYTDTEKKRKEKQPIHVDPTRHSKLRMSQERQKFFKQVYGKDKETFTDLVIDIQPKQAEALEVYLEQWINLINKCIHCGKIIPKKDIKASEDYSELVMTCTNNCMGQTRESSGKSKEFIAFFQALIKEYGHDFREGFPPALRAESRNKCLECGGYHDAGAIWTFDFA